MRLPRPFPDKKFWLGNSLSKLDLLSNTEKIPTSSNKEVIIFLLLIAGYGRSKKIQTWPPFPERERSRYAGIPFISHPLINRLHSSSQFLSSKSATINHEALSFIRG